MKTILIIEELMLLALGFYLFILMDLPVWWFFALLLVPDVGMLGYLGGNTLGAITYNICHHRGLAVLLYVLGKSFFELPALELTGIVLFSHAAMDRIFGYGLKYNKGFKYTHLGEIGKNG